jgi:hypothetical protein
MMARIVEALTAASVARIERLAEPERSLAMMNEPGTWPAYPFLMVRHSSFKLGDKDVDAGLGFMIPDPSTNTAYPIVLLGNFTYHVVLLKDKLNTLPRKRYTSLELVVADGWRVD